MSNPAEPFRQPGKTDQAGRARTSELKALAPQLGRAFVGDFAPTSAANATADPRHDFEALRAAFGDFRRFQGSMRPRLWNWMLGDCGPS